MTEVAINKEQDPNFEKVVAAVTQGLVDTYELHERLGLDGVTEYQENQYGEAALVMDVQSEERIIHELRETKLPMYMVTEEHKQFMMGEEGQPVQYTVSLDGLDGSNPYKTARGEAMYGAMVCVMKGDDPTYGDYVAAGMMIHSPVPKLFLAVKDQGCLIIDPITKEKTKVKRNRDVEFSSDTPIDLDRNWPPYRALYDDNKPEFPNMDCAFFSAAARCALFAEGKIDVGIEWTRKNNLELATVFAFAKELGSITTDARGEPIDKQRFISYEQDDNVPIIVAPSQAVATQVSEKFNLPAIKTDTFDVHGKIG